MSKATLESLLGGAEVGAVDNNNAVIDLSSETNAIELAGDASKTGLFGSANGALNAKLKGNKGTLTLKGKEASFTAHTELNGDIGLAVFEP